MEVLGYLTQNSLVSYPFKDKVRITGTANPNPIEDDWFYDILFTSFQPSTRNIYVSRLEKTVSGELSISFADAETLASLISLNISSNDFVSHHGNTSNSFAYASTINYAVKVILGPGLVVKAPFLQTYTVAEAELTSAAITLAPPRVTDLAFHTYDSTLARELGEPDLPFVVKTYTTGDIPEPLVHPRHNSDFASEGVNSGGLLAGRRLGAGVYNPCSDNITDLHTINKVPPDSSGRLFFNPSSCYTANVLTANEEILLGNYLDPYHNATIHTSPTTTTTADVVSLNSSIVLQNYCKPKCAPEYMNAFAYYLNRVTDGASDLAKLAFNNKETRGRGSFSGKVFTASEFCGTDPTFIRCINPTTQQSYVGCNAKFIKNFHEGCTLRIGYSDPRINQYYKITAVSSDGQSVTLDVAPPAPTKPGALPFLVDDNGVLSNMNCATRSYNLDSSQYSKPYCKLNYTSTDCKLASGKYGTLAAVAVGVFNPSPDTKQLQVIYTIANLRSEGSIKLRKKSGFFTLTDPDPVITLACREYAVLDRVFSIQCDHFGGSVHVDLWDVTSTPAVKIGDTQRLPRIDGMVCPDTSNHSVNAFLPISQTNWASFSGEVVLPPGATEVSQPLDGDVPPWLTSSVDYSDDNGALLRLRAVSAPQETLSTTFSTRFTYRTWNGIYTVGIVNITYTALPSISFSNSMAYIVSDTVYTTNSPVYDITAKNMTYAAGFGEASEYFYSYTSDFPGGGLPPDIVFNTSTGTLTGQVFGIFDPFNIAVTAHNPAGTATKTITLRFYLGAMIR